MTPEQRRFAQLQAVDVEGVLPAVRADLPDENVTRKDEAVRYEDRWVEQGTHFGSSSHGSFDFKSWKSQEIGKAGVGQECGAWAFTTLLPCREGLMKQVPEMEGQFVKVPKIL